MVTTRNAKRSHTLSNNVENIDPKAYESKTTSVRKNIKGNAVKKKECMKGRVTRTPLRENVSIPEQSEENCLKEKVQSEIKIGESMEKPLCDTGALLEPRSLPIWDPVDNWFDETKTSKVKKTFARKHNLLLR
ncbi:hypothetical protein GAYE_SCF04G2425 [Galdieria yellowstonensis]|uniref:Uncharacterized protein n=1 Tax=Galdieria yellowstonensis TaxID=3028027 RepID=A0AAV9IBA0_9RHOD|nr:hypothetical protein GAYE_SCF04G2425 [Galdieria yellowstonensis]